MHAIKYKYFLHSLLPWWWTEGLINCTYKHTTVSNHTATNYNNHGPKYEIILYPSTHNWPSGSPSAHATRTKALTITTFASCIVAITTPVLWNSRQLQLVQLSECQWAAASAKILYPVETMLHHINFLSCWVYSYGCIIGMHTMI